MDMDMNRSEVELKRMGVYWTQEFSMMFLKDSTHFRHEVERMTGKLRVQLSGEILGIDVAPLAVYRCPATWWDHLKSHLSTTKWFPKAILKKYPPKFNKKEIHLQELYPMLKPALDNHCPVYRVAKISPDQNASCYL